MRKYFDHIFIVMILMAAGSRLAAQDLSDLKAQKPVKISGSIGAGANFYTSNEAYETRDPFNWNLYGSLTANIYGISLPFSFVVNQFSKSYSTPFRQFGLSPTYKWATVHLGYRSMSFSPLVFGGQTFLGGGLELKPGKFRFGGFYGRLNKAINEDTTYDHRIEPQYSRMGYGLKMGIEGNSGSFTLSAFHAGDDKNSIKEIKDTLNSLLPQENTVVGGSWSLNFLRVFSWTGDAALSLINRDVNFKNLDSIGHYEVPKFVRTFSPINASSAVSYSGRTQLSANLKGANFSAGYQRIQPDYISLGTPYTVNDVETFNGTAGTSFLKGRISLNASYSDQHNNLNRSLASELHSRAGNFAVNANVTPGFIVNMNINGAHVFQQDGALKLDDDVKMNQLMMSYSLSPTFMSIGGINQHVVSLSSSYTNLDDRNPVTAEQAAGDNINLSANYSLQFSKAFAGFNTGVSYSVYGQKDFRYQSTGVNIGGNVQLLKQHQWSIQGNVGYYFNQSKGETVGNNTSFSLNSGYNAGKHSFSLYSSYFITPPVNLNPLDKINRIPIAVNSKNLSAGISYGYQF